MAKGKATIFFCKECGHESAKWLGQCPGCKEWNTFVEAPTAPKSSAHVGIGVGSANRIGAGVSARGGGKSGAVYQEVKPQTLKEIAADTAARCQTGFQELDRVLGGGIVAGSLVLVGGDPGIGKSTLLLQMCRNLAASQTDVMYISGEESLHQIKLRVHRPSDPAGRDLPGCDRAGDPAEGAPGSDH